MPAVPALDNTLGAMLLGAQLSLILYGFGLHQFYRYLRLYPSDIFFLKAIVWAVMTLDTCHTVLSIIMCYHYMVQNYDNPGSLQQTHWTVNISVLFLGLTTVVSQSFYARRVYLVGKRYRIIVAIAAAYLVVVLGLTIAGVIVGFQTPDVVEFLSKFNWLASTCFGSTVFVDVLLTGTLIFALWRSRTGIRQTDSVLDLLMVYAINTGLLTSVVGLLVFIFSLATPKNFIYLSITFVDNKLYANSVLAALNSRQRLSAQITQSPALELDTIGQTSRMRSVLATNGTGEVPVIFPKPSHSSKAGSLSFARSAHDDADHSDVEKNEARDVTDPEADGGQ
ncbi:hypothetical protein BV20DRAFT_1050315 [Pilatotrama ljubarskyi]|nr:hypothetical protein BV20DRAFT_1050315 [Pilatotrama ljubarskyi]